MRIVAGLAAFVVPAASLLAATGSSFSFVLIADPHIRWSHYQENRDRLEQCVRWINAERDTEDIHLVFVLGDIGWESNENRRNIQHAKEILDTLSVPYIPIIGDDDILFGRDGLDFAVTFEPVYRALAAAAEDSNSPITNWRRARVDMPSPYRRNAYCFFQNFALEYKGVQFVCADWCSRDGSKSIFRTQDDDADLHDFAGGTWPWFRQTLIECPRQKRDNIVLLTHNPMVTLRGGWFMRTVAKGLAFSPREFAKLSAFLNDPAYGLRGHIYANFAGHVHFQGFLPADANPDRLELPRWLVDLMSEETARKAFPPLPGYDVYTIQAPHVPHPAFGPPTHPDDEIRLQVVTVFEQEDRFAYEPRSVLVNGPPAFVAYGPDAPQG